MTSTLKQIARLLKDAEADLWRSRVQGQHSAAEMYRERLELLEEICMRLVEVAGDAAPPEPWPMPAASHPNH